LSSAGATKRSISSDQRRALEQPNTMSSDEEEFEFGEKEEEEEEHDEEEEEEEADDDEPISKSRKRRASSAPVKYAEDDDDDDDNEFDDVPLAHLVSAKKKAKTAETKKKADAKKTASPKKSAPAAKKVSTKPVEPAKKSTNEDYRTLSSALFSSECVKGQLIQKLLCRWWYAFQWPTNLPDKPPKGYDLMDGIPGVYVCVEGNDVGKIKDLRDMKSKPSFSNFLSKDSEELKELLIRAVQGQMKALVDAEGEGTPTEKELKDMLKWVNKVNVDKADKEAARVLKKAGMASQ
jgi:hypothetical protein